MLLRQVQARPLQGHHLRAVRRRGDAAEGAPRAHGPHRPRSSRLAHLVLQGRSRAGSAICSTSLRASSRRCSTSPPRSSPTWTRRRGRRISPTSRTRSAPSTSRRRRPRRAARHARGSARPPTRLPGEGQGEELRRGRRVLGPRAEQLGGGADHARLSTDARDLVGGMFAELAPKVSTEDSKKIRELVRNTAIRDDRRLTPRELEAVAQTSIEIRDALAPLRKELGKATGSKKGAITKHLNRVLDGLLHGGRVERGGRRDRRRRRQEAPRDDSRARQRPARRARRPARGRRATTRSASSRTTSACAPTAGSRRRISTPSSPG